MWQNWVNVVAGVWLILAPFILKFGDSAAAKWNSIIFGIVIAALAIWSNTEAQSKGVSRSA